MHGPSRARQSRTVRRLTLLLTVISISFIQTKASLAMRAGRPALFLLCFKISRDSTVAPSVAARVAIPKLEGAFR